MKEHNRRSEAAGFFSLRTSMNSYHFLSPHRLNKVPYLLSLAKKLLFLIGSSTCQRVDNQCEMVKGDKLQCSPCFFVQYISSGLTKNQLKRKEKIFLPHRITEAFFKFRFPFTAHVMKYLIALSLLSSEKTSWCETKKSSAGGYVIIFHSKISLGSHTHKHTDGE